MADHPYFGDKLDAYALTGFLLGRTERITGMVTVTNLPSRPAPVLARTLTSLSALSGGRVILGIGAGAIWDMIVKLGVPRLDGGAAVRAMAEAITLVRALSGGGTRSTFDGEFYHVSRTGPGRGARPRGSFTGSVGPKIPGRHRAAGRRLDPAGRLGLAEPALPRVAAPGVERRRGRGSMRQGRSGGDASQTSTTSAAASARTPRTARRHPGSRAASACDRRPRRSAETPAA